MLFTFFGQTQLEYLAITSDDLNDVILPEVISFNFGMRFSLREFTVYSIPTDLAFSSLSSTKSTRIGIAPRVFATWAAKLPIIPRGLRVPQVDSPEP